MKYTIKRGLFNEHVNDSPLIRLGLSVNISQRLLSLSEHFTCFMFSHMNQRNPVLQKYKATGLNYHQKNK